jgi:hypothetical protein
MSPIILNKNTRFRQVFPPRRDFFLIRPGAGGVVDERVAQLLRQGDSQVFKKCSQKKLQMQRETLLKLNRRANEMPDLPA